MTDTTFPSGLFWQLWTLMVMKTLLLQNGNSWVAFVHVAWAHTQCCSRHSILNSFILICLSLQLIFLKTQRFFILVPLYIHCLSQVMAFLRALSTSLVGGRGHYIFSDGHFRQAKPQMTCLLSDIKLLGVGTWGHSLTFQAGAWAACPGSVLSFAAVLIPSGCQLYQPVLRGYLRCCQFSCLNWESFNAGDWDSWRGRIWSIPDNGMADIVFVVRLCFGVNFKDCWHTWVFLGLQGLWFQP